MCVGSKFLQNFRMKAQPTKFPDWREKNQVSRGLPKHFLATVSREMCENLLPITEFFCWRLFQHCRKTLDFATITCRTVSSLSKWWDMHFFFGISVVGCQKSPLGNPDQKSVVSCHPWFLIRKFKLKLTSAKAIKGFYFVYTGYTAQLYLPLEDLLTWPESMDKNKEI